jgi:hypothetical protein
MKKKYISQDEESGQTYPAMQESEPKHTPTPWHMMSQEGYNASHGREYEIADQITNGIWTAHCQSNKDAEFIVLAVNSYDGLINAVKDLRYAFYVENSSKKLKEAFTKHADVLKTIIAQSEEK